MYSLLTRSDRPGIVSTLMTACTTHSAMVLAVLLALVSLTPLAYASPPDPVWVSGYFDDDDHDDVVVLVTSSGAAVDPFPLVHESITPAPTGSAVPDETRPASSTVLSSRTPRSPPAS